MIENVTRKNKMRLLIILGLGLFAIKILYMKSVELMLPNMWLQWSMNKNVSWDSFYIEVITFVIVFLVYAVSQAKDSTISFFSTVLFIIYFIPNNSVLVLSGYELDYYLLVNLFCFLLFGVVAVISSKEKRQYTLSKQSGRVESIVKIWDNKALISTIRVMTIVFCLFVLIHYNI